MAGYDGSIRINTLLNTSNFENSFKKLGGSIKSLLGTLGLGLGISGLVNLGKQAIKTAADFEAMESQFSQVFGDLESVASKSLSEVANQAGIMEERMKPSFTKIAAFAKTTGMNTAESLALSERAMIAVADSAAFYDRSLEETTESLQSFLKGNYENDAALGLSATETTRNAAANKLYGKSFNELSEAQKQLTLLQMVEDANALSGALGQAAREADTWTNQVGNLNQAWTNLKATLGKFILPIAIQAVKAITNVINAIDAMLARLYVAVGKIRELLTGKKVSTEISFETEKTGIDIGDEYSEATEGAENLASANDDIAESAKKAGKAAKGALAPFDDLQVLMKDSGGGEAGGAGIGGGFEMPDLEMEDVETEEVDSLSSAIDGLIARLNELKDIFMEGFWDGLGDWEYRWEDIKENIASIKNTILEIITNVEVLEAVGKAIESTVRTIGTIIGSVLSVILTIIDAVTGGIAKFLEQNKERIESFIITISNIVTEINDLISKVAVAIAYVFEAFSSEEAQQLIANILGIVFSLSGVVEFVYKLFRDLLEIVVKPFIENAGKLKTALEGLLGFLSSVLGTIKQGLDDTFDKLNKVYDAHFKPFFDSIAQGLSDLVGTFLEVWNTYIQPILDSWAEKFDILWTEHIQPMIDNFLELLGSLAELLTWLWEEILQPQLEWFIEVLGPTIGDICDFVYSVVSTAITLISDMINGIVKIVKGVIDILMGLVKGDWQKVWDGFASAVDGMKTIVKGIVNSIIGIVESLANAVVAAINTVIRALNSLHIDVPDWVTRLTGITDFGFNLSEISKVEIPRLATGAVIRGGNPFMAILGDQPVGKTNIEAPLDTIKQAVREELSGLNLGNTGGTLQVVLNVNGEDLAQATLNDFLSEMNRQGYDVSILGVT